MTTPRRPTFSLRMLDRLTYPQKFVLISLLFLLPLAGFAPLAIQQYERTRDYGAHELYGAAYLRPLQALLVHVQAHDEQTRARLRGQTTATEVAAMQSQVERDLADLNDADQEYGSALKTGSAASTLSDEWNTLKNSTFASEADSEARHAELVADIRALINTVGKNSFLILDPDIDTYFVMDAVLLKQPEIQMLLARAANLGGAVARHQSLSPAELKTLIQYTDRLNSNLAGMTEDVTTALGDHTNTIGSLDATEALAATETFVKLIDTQIINSLVISVSPDELAAAAHRAIEANTAFYENASTALERGIQARKDRYTQTLVVGLVIALSGVGIGFALGLGVMLTISRPLSHLTLAANRLSTGDLAVRVNVTNSDETGQVGQAFNNFIDTLSNIVRGLVDNSTKLSSSATQLAATSAELLAGAESQTQQVIRTSSAMEEMSATIKDMARNATTTSVAAEAAVQRALLGSAKVQAALTGLNQTNRTLQQLQERSAEIDAVVRLIADIAAQTNILALNAAIEAAGAGAAGARFDVVAEEIRKLAGRTAESTARISATVAEVQRQIQAGAAQMSETTAQAAAVEQALSEIVDGITSVNDMVTLVSTSTTQQAKAADQVAESLQLITQVSQQTAEAMRESTVTIDDLSHLARGMNATAGRFKI